MIEDVGDGARWCIRRMWPKAKGFSWRLLLTNIVRVHNNARWRWTLSKKITWMCRHKASYSGCINWIVYDNPKWQVMTRLGRDSIHVMAGHLSKKVTFHCVFCFVGYSVMRRETPWNGRKKRRRDTIQSKPLTVEHVYINRGRHLFVCAAGRPNRLTSNWSDFALASLPCDYYFFLSGTASLPRCRLSSGLSFKHAAARHSFFLIFPNFSHRRSPLFPITLIGLPAVVDGRDRIETTKKKKKLYSLPLLPQPIRPFKSPSPPNAPRINPNHGWHVGNPPSESLFLDQLR